MSVRAKLLLTRIIALTLLLLYLGAAFYVNDLEEVAKEKQDSMNGLVTTIFERNIFMSEYLVSSAERAKEQLVTANGRVGVLRLEARPFFKDPDNIEKIEEALEHHRVVAGEIEGVLEQGMTSKLSERRISQVLIRSQAVVGIMHNLSLGVTEEYEFFEDLQTNALIIFTVLVAGLGLSASLVIKSITQSIKKLHKSTDIIAGGNLDHRVDVKTKDEFGQLASSFNKMTEALQESQKGLEGKVKARTVELEKSIKDLNKLNKLMTGRELKMIELKEEIAKLQEESVSKKS